MYQNFFKRFFDIVFSLILILFFLPIMILLSFLIWYFIGYPIFMQKRPGLNNKIFTLYKFKTLNDTNKNISDKKRQTRFGNFLRKTGIDEMPQLLNIIRGEMSFIGPRPLLMKYLKLKQFAQHPRCKCNPGITGLAQIQRNKDNKKGKWKVQLNFDKYYSENLSIFLDAKIFLLTIIKIFLLNKKEDYLIEKPLTKKNI